MTGELNNLTRSNTMLELVCVLFFATPCYIAVPPCHRERGAPRLCYASPAERLTEATLGRRPSTAETGGHEYRRYDPDPLRMRPRKGGIELIATHRKSNRCQRYDALLMFVRFNCVERTNLK